MASDRDESPSAPMAPRLRFRTAARQDADDIVALLNATFRTPIDRATWEWYVYGNPNGPSRVYLAQDAGDAIVGVIAFAPMRFRLQGATIAATYAHHLALKPNYRDTLTYVALCRFALGAEATQNVKFTIGPPNRTAYPIHKTMFKWVDFGYLDCVRKLSPSASKHPCKQWTRFPDSFDRFYDLVSKDLKFCVEKNAEWMNWRICQRPGSPYTVYADANGDELAGYVVMKRWQDSNGYRKAHILDVHAANDEALANVIAAAETYAADCEELNLWAVLGFPYRSSLESMGFAASPTRQPLLVKTFDGSLMKYPEGNCSLSYGDGDTLY